MATSNKKQVAIAIFYGASGLEAALAELVVRGVEDHDFCLLARENAIGIMVRGGESVHLAPMADDLVDVGCYGGTEPLLASTGRELERLLNAAPADKSISECLSAWIPARQSKLIEQCLDQGEVVLWVRTDGGNLLSKVPEVLLRHTNRAVQVHEISRQDRNST